MVKIMKRRCVDNITVQGYSHLLNNKECQDNSVSWDGGDYSAVIVCDGHGGEKYFRSRLGSQFACLKGKECIEKFMYSPDFSDKGLRQLELSIIQEWNRAVAVDADDFPFDKDSLWKMLSEEDRKALVKSPAKAYGTTFIAAICKYNFCAILKLGDGNVNIISARGRKYQVERPRELADNQLQFNLTTSLCSGRADLDFKHCQKSGSGRWDPIVGVILTTDGVINSYSSERAYRNFIENICKGYLSDPIDKAHTELKDFMNELSQKGSGDDLSIAIALRPKR